MISQIQLTNSTYQSQHFEFEDIEIEITLTYHPVAQLWTIDVLEDNKVRCTGMPLSVGVPILKRTTAPYFFYVEDTSGLGLDPVFETDFNSRCELYICSRDEL